MDKLFPNNQKRKKKSGYIYLLSSDLGFYKIGCTSKLPERMMNFGVKLPFRITLLKAVTVNDIYGFEKWFHNYFAKERVRGEWFLLDEIHIKNFVGFADQADLEDYIKFMSG